MNAQALIGQRARRSILSIYMSPAFAAAATFETALRGVLLERPTDLLRNRRRTSWKGKRVVPRPEASDYFQTFGPQGGMLLRIP